MTMNKNLNNESGQPGSPLKKIGNWIQSLVLWIPMLSLLVGGSITVYIYDYLKERETDAHRANFYQRAHEAINQLDLELSNSLLRIQTYEDVIGPRPLDYGEDGAYVAQALGYTLFHRLSVYKDQSANKGPKDISLKLIARVSRPDSLLPVITANYIQSPEILVAARELKSKSSYYKTVLFERNGLARISVIVRSKISKDIFFIFTAPLSSLFAKIDFATTESVLIRDTTKNTGWLITKENNDKVIKYLNPAPEFSSYSFVFEKGLVQSGLDLNFEFTYARQDRVLLSTSNIGGLFSSLITIIVAYLFYVLITLNRKTQRIVINKTIDLEKTAHDLQEALNGKTKFLGKISHEIRTPLNLILGMIDLCEENDTEKKLSQYLRSMKSSGEHLLSMIDDLLDLAKAETSDFNMHSRKTYLVQFLSDVAKLCSQDCENKQLKFYVSFAPNLPSVVACDPNRLRQVLLNLLRNACKYTNQGFISLNVSLGNSNNPDPKFANIRFEIKDTGVGIPKDKIAKVFDAFFQVERSSAYSEGGVGLGLSIVKDIVNKMGGHIEVKSKVQSGSSFYVDLDLEVYESTPWVEIYRNETAEKKNIIFFSGDSLLLNSIEPLRFHPQLNFKISSSIAPLEVLKQAKLSSDTYVVIDIESLDTDIQKIIEVWDPRYLIFIGKVKKAMSLISASSVSVLNSTPFIPLDLLNALGFSSRSRQREAAKNIAQQEKTKEQVAQIKDDLKVIVADDDLGNIELYKAYFAKTPWKISYAINGLEAWNFYQQEKPDLMILDVRMPEMDGFSVIEKVRDEEGQKQIKAVPIVLVTADLLDYTAEKAKTYDRVTLLTKPLKKTMLFEQINIVL